VELGVADVGDRATAPLDGEVAGTGLRNEGSPEEFEERQDVSQESDIIVVLLRHHSTESTESTIGERHRPRHERAGTPIATP